MKKGFTLIELLVVISIVAILSTVVIAVLGSARNKAKDIAFLAEAKEFQRAIETYAAFEGDYPNSGDEPNAEGGSYPGAANCQTHVGGTWGRNWADMVSEMGDYLPEHFQAPGDDFPYCLLYYNRHNSNCSEDPSTGYNIMFTSYDDIAVNGFDSFIDGAGRTRVCLYSL